MTHHRHNIRCQNYLIHPGWIPIPTMIIPTSAAYSHQPTVSQQGQQGQAPPLEGGGPIFAETRERIQKYPSLWIFSNSQDSKDSIKHQKSKNYFTHHHISISNLFKHVFRWIQDFAFGCSSTDTLWSKSFLLSEFGVTRVTRTVDSSKTKPSWVDQTWTEGFVNKLCLPSG